ncbi:MAG TPA: hypothetical protein VGL19_04105, partial [Polyangiaceae bacterium]
GRFSISEALRAALPSGPWSKLREAAILPASWKAPLRLVMRLVEDELTSDYGEIVELNLTEPPYRVRYVYLEGSYIAGGSSFSIEASSASTSKVVQVFEYQELRLPYVLWLSTSVLPIHYAVVHSQIAQAAELAGGLITDCDVPREYLT